MQWGNLIFYILLWIPVSSLRFSPSWLSVLGTDLTKYWQTRTFMVRKPLKLINIPEKFYFPIFCLIANELLIRLSRIVLRRLYSPNEKLPKTWILEISCLHRNDFQPHEMELPASNLYGRTAWKQVNVKGKNRWCVKRAIMDYKELNSSN